MTFNNRLACSIVALTEMAKRRNKNKSERRLAAIVKSKELSVLSAEKGAEQDAENEENFESLEKENSLKVLDSNSVTEKEVPFGEVTESAENICSVKPKPRGVKSNGENMDDSEVAVPDEAASEADETLIFPREIAGETCLDIECGTNDAVLYLSKLCLGSKGACILHGDDWLTPNEFQSVSGRETAKDWKRSIRHKGKSLKLLITKGLISMNAVSSPKKSSQKPASPAPEIADEAVTDEESTSESRRTEKKRVSPGRVVKAKPSQRLFKKAGKGKRGRKPKKVKVKAKQNVALVRPLQKIVQEESIELPEEVATEDIKLDVNDHVEKKPDVEVEEVKDDLKVDLKEDAKESTPPIQDGGDVKTVPEPIPADDKKEEPAPSESTEKIEVKEEEEEMDKRTDEERRLDEFVKSLRLTKTTNVTPVKAAPQLIPIEEKKEVEVLPEDPEDSEMPVLQKEPCIDPLVGKVGHVVPEVDPLHAAVTPPPTPPSENPLIKKVVEEDQEVLFKVRLSSPSNGLKLTINREKVKPGSESDDSASNTEVTPPTVPVKEQNIQAMLLQDALQSAKKYKEQLQQNKQQCFTAPSAHARKPTASVNSIAATPTYAPATSKPTQEFTKPAFINGAPKPLVHSHLPSSHVTTSHVPINHVSPSHVIPKTHVHSQARPRVSTEDRSSKTRHVPGHSHPKTQNHVSKPQETPTSSEAMAMMPHLYGSLPFPVESRESALAALQAFHLKDKMSPFNAHHAAAAQAQANLLHPVITQQLLMAMTQQLYSMYNIPQQQQQQQQQQPQRPKSTAAVTEHRPSQNSKSLPEIRHRHSDNKHERHHAEKTVTAEAVNKKRKHSAVPSDGTDVVLDLSVKKPKTDTVSDTKCNTSHTNSSVDSPLDFSVKRKAMSSSESKYAVHNNKPHTSQGSVRHSFHHSDYKYSDRVAQPAKTEEKRFPVGCTCKTGSAFDDISAWSVDMVCSFLSCLDGCSIYAKTFREQGITGRLLPYLTTQHLTRTLGMKVGPALTLMHAVERKFREQMTKQTCAFCSRNRHARTIQI